MKELDELHLPDDIRYTDEHECADHRRHCPHRRVRLRPGPALGDIVFVELLVGDTIARARCSARQPVKAVSELTRPSPARWWRRRRSPTRPS